MTVFTLFIAPMVCWVRGHRWHRWSWHTGTRDFTLCERCGALRGA